MSPLNARQQRFVAEYLKLGVATQAAIAAGYSVHTAKEIGSRLLAQVNIRAALDGERSKLAEHARQLVEQDKMDAAWVRERAARVIAHCMELEPMNASGAIKGLELIAKSNGMFQDIGTVAVGLSIHLHLGGFPK